MGKAFDLVRIAKTAIRVITSPTLFFKEMPRTGGFIEPLVFMVVMGFIGGLIQAVFGIAGLQQVNLEMDAISFIMMLTILIVVSGFVAAAIYFIIWKLMGSQESFETAYRCNAYISALIPITAVLSPFSYVNQIVSVFLITLFLVIASVQVHNQPVKKAWLVFGILGLIFMVASIASESALRHLQGTEMDMQENLQELYNINKETYKALLSSIKWQGMK